MKARITYTFTLEGEIKDLAAAYGDRAQLIAQLAQSSRGFRVSTELLDEQGNVVPAEDLAAILKATQEA